MTRRILHLTLITIVFASVGSGGMTSRALPFSSAVRAVAQPSAGALTPASVALLVNKWDAQAIDTARRAIASDDPAIRAVSARLAGSTGSAELADAIATALEREKDPLGGSRAGAGAALSSGRRSRGADQGTLRDVERDCERLCRMAVQGATRDARRCSARDRLGARRRSHRAQFPRADRPGPAAGVERAVAARLARRRHSSVVACVPGSSSHRIRPGPGRTPCSSRRSTRRTPALVRRRYGISWSGIAQGRPVPAAVLDAAVPVGGQDPATAVTWEQFGREVVARHHASRRTPDRAALVTAEGPQHVVDSRALAVLQQTTEPERRALQAVLGERFPEATR